MKKIAVLALVLALLCASACAEIDLSELSYEELLVLRDEIEVEIAFKAPEGAEPTPHAPTSINPSPDKYTWYVQDYVGRNAAGFGYLSLGGERRERYGDGNVRLIFVLENGGYLDYADEELLKQYVVAAQSPAPNTEMKLVYETDSEGNEYSNLVAHQSIEQIELLVRRIDGGLVGEDIGPAMTPIDPAPDRYTWYIRDYVGRNLAAFGYTSWGGNRMDAYGEARVRLVLVAEDGTLVDPQDENQLRQYYVTGQDVPPDTEMHLTFEKDSDGVEYDNLVESQSYEAITLYIRKLPDEVIATIPVVEETEEE